jgi:hypothetical protein
VKTQNTSDPADKNIGSEQVRIHLILFTAPCPAHKKLTRFSFFKKNVNSNQSVNQSGLTTQE